MANRETDPSVNAAVNYLLTGDAPSDPKLGTIDNGRFVPGPIQEVQTSIPRPGPVRRLLKTTQALLNL